MKKTRHTEEQIIGPFNTGNGVRRSGQCGRWARAFRSPCPSPDVSSSLAGSAVAIVHGSYRERLRHQLSWVSLR